MCNAEKLNTSKNNWLLFRICNRKSKNCVPQYGSHLWLLIHSLITHIWQLFNAKHWAHIRNYLVSSCKGANELIMKLGWKLYVSVGAQFVDPCCVFTRQLYNAKQWLLIKTS